MSLKSTCDDDFSVEFEVLPSAKSKGAFSTERQEIDRSLSVIEQQLAEGQAEIDRLNIEIDQLTNTADGLDYTVAVACGILTGILDSLWVGEFSLEEANVWGTKKVNNMVIRVAEIVAKLKGDEIEGFDLQSAVRYLEKNFPIAADKATSAFGGGLQHHLRDFSHHPTIVGLVFSLLTQFTGYVYGTNTQGFFTQVAVDTALIGNNFPEKMFLGVIQWFFHLVSDAAGSSGSIRKGSMGTGLPGPFVSLIKEVSSLPFFKKIDENGNKEFSVWISKLFNSTLLGKRDASGEIFESIKFDWRTELGIVHSIRKQAVPIIINECVVRTFYSIRRLMWEIKEQNVRTFSDLKRIEVNRILPFKNRTIVRMITISSGTFTAVDMADAAIRSAIKSNKLPNEFVADFIRNMVLRVNVIGVGRFTIAIGTDIYMEGNRSRKRNERMRLYTRQIALTNAKVFYKEANMWIAAVDAGEAIEKTCFIMEKSVAFYVESMKEISDSLNNIGIYQPKIKKKNPELINNIIGVLNED